AAKFFGVLVDASAADILNAHDEGEFFFCDAVLVVNVAAGIGHRDRLGAALEQFLHRILRRVTGTGNSADLAFDGLIARLKHFLREINSAITGSLRSTEPAAP